MSRVSIIIPAFNSSKHIKKCLSSVIKQTYSQLEIIVVDDGSTDNTKEIVLDFISKDKRIKYIYQENKGVSYARNRGIDELTGNFVSFIDSDDFVSETFIETLLKTAQSEGADVVECGYYRVFGEKIIPFKFNPKIYHDNFELLKDTLLKRNTKDYNCNKLYAAKVFDNVRYGDQKYSEDFLLNFEIYSFIKKKITISDPLYYYYDNPESAVNKSFTQFKYQTITLGNKEKVKDILKNLENGNKLIPYLAYNQYINCISLYREVKNSELGKMEKKRELEKIYSYAMDYFNLLDDNVWRDIQNSRIKFSIKLFKFNPNLHYNFFESWKKIKAGGLL